jgi:hypothetical protein
MALSIASAVALVDAAFPNVAVVANTESPSGIPGSGNGQAREGRLRGTADTAYVLITADGVVRIINPARPSSACRTSIEIARCHFSGAFSGSIRLAGGSRCPP